MAAATGINRSTLSHDINADRGITPERFGRYLQAVSASGRKRLLRALFMDFVPEELHDELLFGGVRDEDREALPVFTPPSVLTKEQRSALEWLARELAKTDQLIGPVLSICEHFGWERPGSDTIRY